MTQRYLSLKASLLQHAYDIFIPRGYIFVYHGPGHHRTTFTLPDSRITRDMQVVKYQSFGRTLFQLYISSIDPDGIYRRSDKIDYYVNVGCPKVHYSFPSNQGQLLTSNFDRHLKNIRNVIRLITYFEICFKLRV